MVLLLRGPLPEKIDHVVIGLDGSQPALDAMTMAAHLFSFHEKATKITLVSVVSISRVFTMFSPVEYVSALESNLKMTSEALLAEGEKVLAQLAIKNVEMKLTEGHTAEELIKVANELGAGLIVVGSQGKDAIKHFIMGSTSSTLATHANCPVAVFKGDHA
jgi:nucleotide-binding universal stress UspA family protein